MRGLWGPSMPGPWWGADGALTLPSCITLGMSPHVLPVSSAALWLSPAQVTGKNREPRAAGDTLEQPGQCHCNGTSPAIPSSWAAAIK